jgi:tRNA-(ms[2]io[6]A)-hydroxylase
MLGLLTPTDPSWVLAAQRDLAGLLSDHAHCELKAAQSALAVIARFGTAHPQIVPPLTALALEETAHFRAVYVHLRDREASLNRPEPDEYVNALWSATKPERPTVDVLLDRLLVNSLIEARSCERFKCLSEHLDDPELKAFYRGLMEAEARHFRLFCGLAEELFGVEPARTRLAELARREALIADKLPLGPKVHG